MKKRVTSLRTDKNWNQVFEDTKLVDRLVNENLPAYLQRCRWFAGKGSSIKNYRLGDYLEMPTPRGISFILIIEVVFSGGNSDIYSIPIMFQNKGSNDVPEEAVICPIKLKSKTGSVVEATYNKSFRNTLIHQMRDRGTIKLDGSSLVFQRGRVLGKDEGLGRIESRLLGVEQSNTTIVYNDNYFLKFYRKLFRDPNPDLELTQFLTEDAGFRYSPQYAGSITWKSKQVPEITIGLMQKKVDNRGDAWTSTLEKVKSFFAKLEKENVDVASLSEMPLHHPASLEDIPDNLVELIGDKNLRSIGKLGRRTAEMHLALASDPRSRVFSPTLFNEDYDGWLKNKLIAQFDIRHNLVELNLGKLEGLAFDYAQRFLDSKEKILGRILELDVLRLTSQRIRVHGDYHLGQVLITDNDFCILDFEGEPESSIRDRKIKQSPLKDVAGMLRSFHYSVYASIFGSTRRSKKDLEPLFAAGEKYYRAVAAIYLDRYITTAMDKGLDIGYWKEISFLLEYHILEKAVYEIGYEISYRPTWVIIPLQGIMDILEKGK